MKIKQLVFRTIWIFMLLKTKCYIWRSLKQISVLDNSHQKCQSWVRRPIWFYGNSTNTCVPNFFQIPSRASLWIHLFGCERAALSQSLASRLLSWCVLSQHQRWANPLHKPHTLWCCCLMPLYTVSGGVIMLMCIYLCAPRNERGRRREARHTSAIKNIICAQGLCALKICTRPAVIDSLTLAQAAP